MKKKIKQVSSCCGADIVTETSPDFKKGYIGTCNYACAECGRACDAVKQKRGKHGKTR